MQQYSGQNLTIRGKVVAEDLFCEKKSCPAEDSFCGCPETRDLLLKDPDNTIFSQESKSRLRLVDGNKDSLCQRILGTSKYDCGDWQSGAIYDVDGYFYAEKPVSGIAISLDFYFQVTRKNLISSAASINWFTSLSQGLINALQGLFKSSGYYPVR